MTKLVCKIDRFVPPDNYEYSVYDGDKVVATGTSSSLGWVENDAGGYHTKKKFDALYPKGWEITFDF